MNQLSAHKVGLVIGGVMGIWHAVWATMVLLGIAKQFMDWILGLHFLRFEYAIEPFSVVNALLLVVVTGVIGYVIGYLGGVLWNAAHQASHKK